MQRMELMLPRQRANPAGIAAALAIRASPVAPEKRLCHMETRLWFDNSDSATPATLTVGVLNE
jgi:hypothetical protein